MIANRIELRQWTLNMDVHELHKNREVPSAFPAFLGVVDTTLPTKGTAHRSIRGEKVEQDATARVNVLLVRFAALAMCF